MLLLLNLLATIYILENLNGQEVDDTQAKKDRPSGQPPGPGDETAQRSRAPGKTRNRGIDAKAELPSCLFLKNFVQPRQQIGP